MVCVLHKNPSAEHLVVVGIEPVTLQLQVGLTQSSCMSAAQVKSGSDAAADSAGDFFSLGEGRPVELTLCAPAYLLGPVTSDLHITESCSRHNVQKTLTNFGNKIYQPECGNSCLEERNFSFQHKEKKLIKHFLNLSHISLETLIKTGS